MKKHIFTNQNSDKVEVSKNEIESYRGTSYGCAIYLKDESVIRVLETFDYVDSIFDL